MGQIWEVINVDRRERDLAGGAKLQEFFFWQRDYMSSLYRTLQVPCLPDAVDEWLSRGTIVLQPGSLGKLSTEVLDMMFQAILDEATESFTTNLLSCICLAVGCKRLLTVGKRHIVEGLLEHHATVAECRLVCLGEATDATDQAPPGMLTEEELKEIAATKVPAEDDKWAIARRNEEGGDPDVILERCLYQFAMEIYEHASEATWRRDRALSDKCAALWGEKPDPASDSASEEPRERQDPLHVLDRKMVEVLASDCPTYPPGPNVLLNLEKGEYVREAALTVFGKDPKRVTLVHAMLSRICYSQDPGVADELCGDEFVGRCGRGPWAGDRFYIKNEDDMPVPQAWGFTEWRDVTEEVNRLLGNLWRGMGCEAALVEMANRPRHTVYVAGTDNDCICC